MSPISRRPRLSDHLLRDADSIAADVGTLEAERWASGWLGQAWVSAPMTERRADQRLCAEVVAQVSAAPSPEGLAAVTALSRVAPAADRAMLNRAVESLARRHPCPPWAGQPPATPIRAWRAVDVWDSERVLFVEYSEACGTPQHTLMASIVEPGGLIIEKLAVLRPGVADRWDSLREAEEVPMPVSEQPVDAVLADLAHALRTTDQVWPRPDDEDFVELRALAWARSLANLPDIPPMPALADAERCDLVEAFVADVHRTGIGAARTDIEVTRHLARLFLEFGEVSFPAGPLAWSPGWVAVFLTGWLPRKVFLDGPRSSALPETLRHWVRFALRQRGVPEAWIAPVAVAVDDYLPAYAEATDDESAWTPTKQIAAELAARGVHPADSAAVDLVTQDINAERLVHRLFDR
jgi:hypothetical protein